jgi:hypothetical protein
LVLITGLAFGAVVLGYVFESPQGWKVTAQHRYYLYPCDFLYNSSYPRFALLFTNPNSTDWGVRWNESQYTFCCVLDAYNMSVTQDTVYFAQQGGRPCLAWFDLKPNTTRITISVGSRIATSESGVISFNSFGFPLPAAYPVPELPFLR